MNLIVAEKKSNDCQEGCRIPATDNVINLQHINRYCQEGSDMKLIQTKLTESLDPLWCAWFSGFVDGEGCFAVDISKSKTTKLRKRIKIYFQVSLSSKDTLIIEEIKKTLGVGHIYQSDKQYLRNKGMNAKDGITYHIYNHKQIKNILIPLFETLQLKSEKKKDFEKWCLILEIILKKQHYTREGFKEIIQIYETMNLRGDLIT